MMEPLTFHTALTVAFFSFVAGWLFLPIYIIAKLALW